MLGDLQSPLILNKNEVVQVTSISVGSHHEKGYHSVSRFEENTSIEDDNDS